mgnify:FL=1
MKQEDILGLSVCLFFTINFKESTPADLLKSVGVDSLINLAKLSKVHALGLVHTAQYTGTIHLRRWQFFTDS